MTLAVLFKTPMVTGFRAISEKRGKKPNDMLDASPITDWPAILCWVPKHVAVAIAYILLFRFLPKVVRVFACAFGLAIPLGIMGYGYGDK